MCDSDNKASCDITAPQPVVADLPIRIDPSSWRRFSVVVSKWDYKLVLGSGYSFECARAVSDLLARACADARPMEDAWTRPFFGPEMTAFDLRERSQVGDLVFCRIESDFRDLPGGAQVFRRHVRPALVESLSRDGKVASARGLDGVIYAAPKVVRAVAKDDIYLDRFVAATIAKARDLSERSPGLDMLSNYEMVTHLLEQHVRQEPQATPFLIGEAIEHLVGYSLPPGSARAQIDEGALAFAVSQVMGEAGQQKLAA